MTVSAAFVESKYQMLLDWADACSTSMKRDENSASHVYFFHDPEWKIYFQLCFDFWKEAYVRYRVYLQVVQAHLTIALRLGSIDRRTAVAMMGETRTVGTHHRAPEEAFLTSIADYKLAMEDLNGSSMDTLSRDFADLTVTRTEEGGEFSFPRTDIYYTLTLTTYPKYNPS
ncbi:hypothetical protein LX32DRAFT_650360 [Colletotrichum zoysiae]|uniref:Uncharacterized protein n=1 Tax=Colletotrichum zoysiae TaxID=1216348 RepID=A0AAD9M2Q2_9PEZI|nr:hypothetical protein LX32DRAFT_650360 [Colletotrichum zoysiae]